MPNNPVIVDIVRTPMGRGKSGGQLAHIHPVDLLARVLSSLVERNGLDPGIVDDVIVGCVSQIGEQSATPGRQAWLAAGFPVHVPSTTIDRKCGSSQQAVHFAAKGISAGAYDIVIAAGVESMSRIPMGSSRIGMDAYGCGVAARFPDGFVPQGISAELIAARWDLSREDMDAYSARSHHLAASTQANGGFDDEIVPVFSDGIAAARDETIRPGSTPAGLAQLVPAFVNHEYMSRFPEIRWSVTAGNSSQISDGAAAALVMSEAAASRLGFCPRARFVAYDVRADDPLLMLTAPIPATKRVLAKAGLTVDAIDHFEVNEAFASVPLAWLKEMKADVLRLNPRGGAIALGHPLGASGVRLMATMLNGLEQSGGRYGLQTMCEAGGMANAVVLERL
jgi:acetyl-CoA acetyltransferase family protein